MKYKSLLLWLSLVVAYPAHAQSVSDELRGMDASDSKQSPSADHNLALERLQQAAEQGNPEAQYQLGMFYSKTRDYASALKWFRKASDQGNTKARYRVGLSYSLGRGVPQNQAMAEKWFKLAGHNN
jgi:TPR repeat protein